MTLRRWLVFGAALAAMAAVTPARAQAPATPGQPAASGPIYVVTYLESLPAAANAVAAALGQFAAASRKEAGNGGVLALRENGRQNRFAMVEAWQDQKALDAHQQAFAALRERLQAQLASPFDTRPCVGLDVAATSAGGTAPPRGVYVLTHVDVVPTFKDQTIALVKQLVADSRKDAGVVRFDALQQGNRANHMFLVEAWRDAAALAGHIGAAHTRDYRNKLLPMQGALYDERVYAALR